MSKSCNSYSFLTATGRFFIGLTRRFLTRAPDDESLRQGITVSHAVKRCEADMELIRQVREMA